MTRSGCVFVLLVAFGFLMLNPRNGNAQEQSFKSADGAAGDKAAIASSIGTTKTPGAIPNMDFELGPGDVIHISVWREVELTQNSVVRPDGLISLPFAGEVHVAGKTPLAAQDLIRSLLSKYFTNPNVTVSVVEIHSRQVYITGQVQRPGSYPLLASCTVLQLIASAGGLTPYAHKKNIVVLDADSHPIAHFNYASEVKGNASKEQYLQPGFTVVVP